MAEGIQRVRVEELDWLSAMPWLRLFRAFRMAIHPPKLLLALMLAVLIFLSGRLLDLVWGARAFEGEIAQYSTMTSADFAEWRATRAARAKRELPRALYGLTEAEVNVEEVVESPDRYMLAKDAVNRHFAARQRQFRAGLAEARSEDQKENIRRHMADLSRERIARLNWIRGVEPQGVFNTSLRFTLDAFARMITAATRLNFGFSDLLAGPEYDRHSVIGALRDMLVTLPGWLLRHHWGFLLVYGLVALVIWSMLGGAIARLAAVDAARGEPPAFALALSFTGTRWFWFLITPVFPLLIVLALGLILSIGGAIFFNAPILDVIGGLLLVFALACGLLIAMVLILWITSVHLFYAALAVEGTDMFDAISRSFGYLIGRPWRWLFYTLVSLVYGAITYLFLGGVVLLALLAVQYFGGAWVASEVEFGQNRFEAIMPRPRLGQLVSEVDWSVLPFSAKVAAALVRVWVFLLVGLLAAYAISFYFCAHTWIYLLLRRSTDGTEFDEVYRESDELPATREPAPAEAATTPEKLDRPAEGPPEAPPEAPPGAKTPKT